MIPTTLASRLRLRFRVLTTRVDQLDNLVRERDAARRRLADVRDDRDRLATQEARIADELRAYGHLVSTDLPNDVGLALAVERSRARIAGAVFDEDLPTGVIETRAACGRYVDGAPCPLPADHQPPCSPITPPTGYRPELDTGSVARRLAEEYDQQLEPDRGVVAIATVRCSGCTAWLAGEVGVDRILICGACRSRTRAPERT